MTLKTKWIDILYNVADSPFDSGTKELPWGMEFITGCSIIEAESLDEAEKIAQDCPYIKSIRVYEVREHA